MTINKRGHRTLAHVGIFIEGDSFSYQKLLQGNDYLRVKQLNKENQCEHCFFNSYYY